jgi:uncharacterized protein
VCGLLADTTLAPFDRKFPLQVVDLDAANGIAIVKTSRDPPERMHLIPDEYVNPAPIPAARRAAVERWTESDPFPHVREGDVPAEPILAFLDRRRPILLNDDGSPRSLQSVGAVDRAQFIADTAASLRQSYSLTLSFSLSDVISPGAVRYLAIQGPPGTGKTYVATHVLAKLLQCGKKVAVSSNSHQVRR